MKKFLHVLTFTALISGIPHGNLWAMGVESEKELKIGQAFIAPEGFDDNDNVQVVLDGMLPNLCYELGRTKVNVDRHQHLIRIQQFAVKKNIKGCEEEAAWPVPFQQEVFLGQLPAGQYSIDYSQKDKEAKREFKVIRAQAPGSVDETLYAPITNVFIPEMTYATDEGEVALTGVLPSPCLALYPEKIQVRKFNDVIVVLPELTRLAGANDPQCTYVLSPLNVVAPLGSLTPGRYLLHVRSMTGRAVNRVFTVLPKLPNSR